MSIIINRARVFKQNLSKFRMSIEKIYNEYKKISCFISLAYLPCL